MTSKCHISLYRITDIFYSNNIFFLILTTDIVYSAREYMISTDDIRKITEKYLCTFELKQVTVNFIYSFARKTIHTDSMITV